MEANQDQTVKTYSIERRTGRVDAILFGELLEMLSGAIRRAEELELTLGKGSIEGTESRGRVLGIAQSCSHLSGIDAQQLIERAGAGLVRSEL